MPFKKGKSGNENGRPLGAKNKRTLAWEEFTEFCMTGGLEKFVREMKSLKGGMYTGQFLNLLEFHRPKLARTEIVGEDGGAIKIDISSMSFRIKTKGETK